MAMALASKVPASEALASEVPPMYRSPTLHTGLRRRIETWGISFDLPALQRRGSRFQLAAFTLARTGIIVIRAAASPEAVHALAAMVESTWEQVAGLPPGAQLPGVIINRDDIRVIKGYKSLVQSEAAVINFRHGEDNGMMDVFHPEKLAQGVGDLLLDSLHEGLVGQLAVRAFGKPLEVTCRNLYVNRGVANTRFFHCDGERLKIKSFVYLSDVDSLDVGPYCYIKHSHRNVALRCRNQAFNHKHGLNKYEYRQLHGCFGLPIFCRAGDMVVSAQHGAHRGYPQTPSAKRAVLLNVYEPKGEMASD
jgi:hypothetical protein